MKYFLIIVSICCVLIACSKKKQTTYPISKTIATCDSIGLIKLEGVLERFVGKWELVETEIKHYNTFNCFYLYTSKIEANNLPFILVIELTKNAEFSVYKDNNLINFDLFSGIKNISNNGSSNKISVNFNFNCSKSSPIYYASFREINDTLIYATFPDINYNNLDQSIQTSLHILKKVQ